jgi:hypothetical protein
MQTLKIAGRIRRMFTITLKGTLKERGMTIQWSSGIILVSCINIRVIILFPLPAPFPIFFFFSALSESLSSPFLLLLIVKTV